MRIQIQIQESNGTVQSKQQRVKKYFHPQSVILTGSRLGRYRNRPVNTETELPVSHACCRKNSVLRIRILTFYPSRIPGSKRHRIPDLDRQQREKFYQIFYIPTCIERYVRRSLRAWARGADPRPRSSLHPPACPAAQWSPTAAAGRSPGRPGVPRQKFR